MGIEATASWPRAGHDSKDERGTGLIESYDKHMGLSENRVYSQL